ncbi:MAG: acyl-CoA dehydrogenase [Actinobacteria bacterium]|nr:acyl-CoA dehydrogenase [Actinomycetota bacterium]
MPIGITDEHLALHDAVRGWAERHCPPSVPRALLDADYETLPIFWQDLLGQGWTGIHVAEENDGEGYSLVELAIVLEELGRVGAPGPFLGHVLAAAVLQAAVDGGMPEAGEYLSGLAAGGFVGAVALDGALDAETRDDGRLVVRGTCSPVLSGHVAELVLADAGGTGVVLLQGEYEARELPSLDPTRRVAELTVDVALPASRVLGDLPVHVARDLAAVLFAAEAVGASQWCVDTAAAYARDRHQFGRPIGQFQGVKHRCANMLARTELARAAVWDAARAAGDPEVAPLTAASTAALAIEGFVETAKDCIQVLGGIGFTWEHDAHVYLRRALVTRALLGSPSTWKVRACEAALGGARRRLAVDLPEEAEGLRAELRTFLASLHGMGPDEQRVKIAEAGYIAPQWPKPWGRDAGAVEQVVVDAEFRAAKIVRPGINIGAWALPPLMVYGTSEQQERWIPPTLRGEIGWCQLFSEPGAGSDLAGLSTRAERVEGGWVVNGQKVWTSMAKEADWGILLARTNPDAPKHDGISFFILDMSTPGIEIRPLRELTGHAFFNEVFFDDVFVPDDCLVGREHDGWRATRTSLANERVFMGSGSTIGRGVRGILDAVRARGLDHDTAVLAETGELVVRDYALAVLRFRLTLTALGGADPSGSEASVRKLLGVEHDQKVQEVGLGLCGPGGAVFDGVPMGWSHQFLFTRNLTIAGGTSEIQRNIIGERVLGLPRDP